jgi:hypothetical protein
MPPDLDGWFSGKGNGVGVEDAVGGAVVVLAVWEDVSEGVGQGLLAELAAFLTEALEDCPWQGIRHLRIVD